VIFTPTPLSGAFLIEPEPREDERGLFARTWCAREFASHGLNPRIAQCNTSFNKRKGTLRGMHYQQAPHQEAKLMRCTQGAIYDVIVDLRPGSPSYKQYFGAVLSALDRRMLYAPEGFAHGFLTLEEDTEVFYQMSEFYEPGASRGVRWNDPTFAIRWPLAVTMISSRERGYADFHAS